MGVHLLTSIQNEFYYIFISISLHLVHICTPITVPLMIPFLPPNSCPSIFMSFIFMRVIYLNLVSAWEKNAVFCLFAPLLSPILPPSPFRPHTRPFLLYRTHTQKSRFWMWINILFLRVWPIKLNEDLPKTQHFILHGWRKHHCVYVLYAFVSSFVDGI